MTIRTLLIATAALAAAVTTHANAADDPPMGFF